MNAVKILKQDHDKIQDLFKKYEAAGDHAFQKKKNLSDKIFMELEVHSTIEEEIFYPAMRSKSDKEGKEIVAESIEEHHIVKTLIDEVRELDPQDDEFEAKMKVLMESVKHHISREEEKMFPQAKKILLDLNSLGRELEVRKEELTSISVREYSESRRPSPLSLHH